MFLKKLEIIGFKSFADRVVLNFEKGITAIVGPNGSGKSNISDAVRLVLGEQSIKSLRGNKLEDVIFVGTENRKPLSFAEVTLTLDNSDHMLPLDFTEVVITRKIFRSGESEFYINKTQCRLKDVFELFMDTGIGRDGYSIIGQGKIDEILLSRPEDRRQIFEEASGISKYKYKKEEAQKKLVVTNENINRINDILLELQNQLEPLHEQKVKAETFLKLQEEKKRIDITIYCHDIEELFKKLNNFKSDYNAIEKNVLELKTEIESKKSTLNEAELELESFNKQLDRKKQDYYNSINEIETLNGKIELLNEKVKNSEENIDRLKKSLEDSKNKSSLTSKEIGEINENIKEIELKKQYFELELSNLVSRYESIKEESSLKQMEVESAKEDVVDILNEIAENNNILSKTEVMKTNLSEKLSDLVKTQNSLLNDIELKKQEINEIQNNIDSLNSELITFKDDKNSTEEKLKSLENNIKIQNRKYEQTLNEYNSALARLRLLKDMDKEYEGYNHSIKNLMRYIEKNEPLRKNVLGVVGELIDVRSEYSLAIEIALGSAIQDIITETTESAKDLISVLKKNNFGRATFLPLDNITYKPFDKSLNIGDGVIGLASDIIDYDKKIEKAIKFILGRVIVTNDLDTAISLSRKFKNQFKIVTLKGEVINSGGSITGGSILKSQNILKRKEDIKLENVKCNKLAKELEGLEKYKDSLTKEIEKTREKLDDIINNINIKASILNDLIRTKSSLEMEIEKLNTIIKQSTLEEKQLRDVINSYDEEIDKYKDNISQLYQKKACLDKLIRDYKDNKDSNADVLNKLEVQITDLKIELAKYEQKLMNDISKLNEKKLEYNDITESIIEIEKSLDKYENLKIMYEKDINKSNEKSEILNERLKKINEDIQEMERKIERKLENINTDKEILAKLEDEYSKEVENKRLKELNIQKVEMEIENIKNKLWEDYEITFNNAKANLIKENILTLKQQLSKINASIKDLGIVNLNAIEEYKNLKERYDFLKMQYDDLVEAKNSLNSIIDDANKIIKTKFKDNFNLIEAQFKETFKKLFGGGRAELILTNPDDLLNTGIEINVQPPGKKLQNISLLSGGEKALVAISLLFAMILIRPTPFCILDEIDAALDDANVDRFASYLKDLSRESQFIVVTHRKGTMSVADTLYGVTMQEKGVSKLLSLKLESA
ncbi:MULTISPECIES: chromosome segregation protein SMC [Thermoanaerobacterium]|uniref:Chromosome partition protein Smc n=2 Tax=Thermoanaerobacterium TaxID=28895 RepID=W9E9M8_9THEO|nr:MULTISPECIES: chromosome segregation protein SMC [Thermoanaerobacterium]AFK86765.1 chromosome segregation protein SMC [Thermoanaerobacterium saccharolyticum JW/SL-YS485]ETO38617.1 chromosome segregation protein SMC [Thermoanaerobacterium aotearoense SCUT27]